MKHTTLFIVLITLTFTASAQKNSIKVKKGKIIKKDVPIATIDGKGGVFKAHDLVISSLTNKPLIHIQQEAFNMKSLLYPTNVYYHITFFNAANTVVDYSLLPDQPKHYENGIVNFMFNDSTGINLLENDSTLSDIGVQQFAKKYHTNLKADSTDKALYLKTISDALEGNALRRKDQQIILKMTNKREDFISTAEQMANEYEYEIMQDGVVIGTVIKTITSNSAGSSSRIVVKKAVIKPFDWKGSKQFLAEAAVMQINGSFGEIRTFYDDKRHELPPNNGNSSEYIIANFLINKGYL